MYTTTGSTRRRIFLAMHLSPPLMTMCMALVLLTLAPMAASEAATVVIYTPPNNYAFPPSRVVMISFEIFQSDSAGHPSRYFPHHDATRN